MKLSIFPNTIYLRDSLFSIMYSCLLCCRLGDRDEQPQYCSSCCGITLFQGLIVSFNFTETEWIKKMWYMYGFLGWLNGKISSANEEDREDMDLIPGSGRSPGRRNGNPLQYSCLENSMDREAWRTTGSPKESDMTEQLSIWECAHGSYIQWNIAQP